MHLSQVALAFVLALFSSAALAHGGGGGGGGGGHGGGHYTYVPGVGIYGGGISAVPAPTIGDYSKIKTVAIVSAVGQKLTMGVVALLTAHREIDISDWNLDQFTQTTIAHYLSQRFTIKDVPYDRAALAAIPNNHFDTESGKAVSDYLSKLPAQGIDAFIVIRPDSEGTAPPTAGLSFDDTQGFLLETSEIANYEIDVIDARTLSVISHAMSRIALREKIPAGFAAIKVSADLADLHQKDTPTDAQRLKMKRDYTKLMAFSLLETVRSLNLGIVLPDVGGRIIVPMTADMAPPVKLKNIAIASAIGDTFAIVERHTFGGVKGKTFVPVPDWQIDSHVEDLIRTNLSKRFTIKDVPVNRDALAQARIDFAPGATNGPLPGLQASNDVDLYLVVVKHQTKVDDPVCSGLGVFGYSGLVANSAMVYVCYDIALVDPHTLKPFHASLGTLSPKWPMPVPTESDGRFLPKSLTALSPDESATLHGVVTTFLDDSIPDMLLRLRLTDHAIQYIPGVTPDVESATTTATTAQAPPGGSAASSTPTKASH